MSYRHEGLLQFYRNSRWGTCVDCPRDSFGNAYPESCRHTFRYDHHLDLDQLVRNIKDSGYRSQPQQFGDRAK